MIRKPVHFSAEKRQESLALKRTSVKKKGTLYGWNLPDVHYTSLVNRLQASEQALEAARQEIAVLKEGVFGSDWQVWQDEGQNRIWITDGKKREILLDAAVKQVTAYWVYPSEKPCFVFWITFVDGIGRKREIPLCSQEFESASAMAHKLESNALYLRVKRSNTMKCQLLKRLILQRINNTQVLPYYSGWQDKTYCFCDQKGQIMLQTLRISAPFMRRVFWDSADNIEKVKAGLKMLFSNFGKEEASLILTIGTGGLLCTPLLAKGYSVDTLFALDADNAGMQDIRKWMQSWKDELCVSLSKKKSLVNALQESRDEVIFLMDEETQYILQLSSFLKHLAADREILAENQILNSASIPILITNRSAIWEQRGVSLLNLPFSSDKRIGAEKTITSQFWHGFCEYLNARYDFWQGGLEELNIPDFSEEIFERVFSWLVASYSVIQPYLQSLYSIQQILSITEFTEYVKQWLGVMGNQKNSEISEFFLDGLREMKAQGRLRFIMPCAYDEYSADAFVLAVDEEHIFASRESFALLVQEIKRGYTSKLVYQELVEADYAKRGDGAHLFPKCSTQAGFHGTRKRMAMMKRNLLLSDAELLLEVGNE